MSDSTPASDTIGAAQLRAFVERIERLEQEGKDINADKRDVYAEMKGNGFSPKAVKALVRLRAMDPEQRQEEQAMLDLYKAALGMK